MNKMVTLDSFTMVHYLSDNLSNTWIMVVGNRGHSNHELLHKDNFSNTVYPDSLANDELTTQ
jgi:hypothetical protein